MDLRWRIEHAQHVSAADIDHRALGRTQAQTPRLHVHISQRREAGQHVKRVHGRQHVEERTGRIAGHEDAGRGQFPPRQPLARQEEKAQRG